MAGILNTIKGYLTLPTESELDQLASQETPKESEKSRSSERSERRETAKTTSNAARAAATGSTNEASPTTTSQPRAKHTASNYGSSTYIENRGTGKAIRMVRPDGSKVIPINTMKSGFEVCIMKPQNFEDSQDICDVLLSDRAAIVNLEGIDNDLAQRIMDFISGSIYSINGKLYQISGYIFIVTCESVDISGDYEELLKQSGFDIPTFK